MQRHRSATPAGCPPAPAVPHPHASCHYPTRRRRLASASAFATRRRRRPREWSGGLGTSTEHSTTLCLLILRSLARAEQSNAVAGAGGSGRLRRRRQRRRKPDTRRREARSIAAHRWRTPLALHVLAVHTCAVLCEPATAGSLQYRECSPAPSPSPLQLPDCAETSGARQRNCSALHGTRIEWHTASSG